MPCCSVIMKQKGIPMNEKNFPDAQLFFGKVMKEHRRVRKNISMETLAENIGMDSNNLTRVERGEQFPKTVTLLKLIYELDIKLEEYLPELIELIKDEEKNKRKRSQ